MECTALKKLRSDSPVCVSLRSKIDRYHPISESTWSDFVDLCCYTKMPGGSVLYKYGEVPASFAFIHSGLVRAYTIDQKGNEYNKAFFHEGMFACSMSAMLQNSASMFGIEALEDVEMVRVNYPGYRRLMLGNEELKLFHIRYLEKHWVDGEQQQVALVMQNAAERYKQFLDENAELEQRLTQYQIASHLGITPTQLSRIRRKENVRLRAH